MGDIVVLQRRGWLCSVVGGKRRSLVFVFGSFGFSSLYFVCLSLLVSAFLGFGCLSFGFSIWFWSLFLLVSAVCFEAAWLSVFWLFYLGVLEAFSVGVRGLLLGFGCLSFGFCLLLFGFVVLLFAFAAGMVHRKIASPGSATKRAIPKMEATICVSANKQPNLPQLCCAVILHRALVLRNRFGRSQPTNKAPEKKIHIYDNITYYIIILFLYIENISDFLLG